MPTFVESFSDYVSQEVIGNTWEGREQKLLKICRGGCGDKPAMYLHGGTHAAPGSGSPPPPSRTSSTS